MPPRRTVEQHQPPLVRFVSRRAPAIGMRSSGRPANTPARRRSRGWSSAASASPPVDVDLEQVAVVLVASTRSVTAVKQIVRLSGANAIGCGPSRSRRRHIVVGAGYQIPRRAAVGRHDEQVQRACLRSTPSNAGRAALRRCARARILLARLIARLVARVVLAVGIHLRRERDRPSIGRPHDVVGAPGERVSASARRRGGRHRARKSATAVALRDERDPAAVRDHRAPPSRPVVVSGLVSPVSSETIQMLRTVGSRRDRERRRYRPRGSVGRKLRLADALHREEIVHRHRSPGGRGREPPDDEGPRACREIVIFPIIGL